jgi:hypothetical protein
VLDEMASDESDAAAVGPKEQYFDALCRAQHLDVGLADCGDGWSIASAHRGSLRIFFESERGFWWFGVGSVDDTRPACSVEGIAGRFPRMRSLHDGAQRLSLEEQRDCIEQHIGELEAMFSPNAIETTKIWLADRSKAYWSQFTSST